MTGLWVVVVWMLSAATLYTLYRWWRGTSRRLDRAIDQAIAVTRPRGPEDSPDWPPR